MRATSEQERRGAEQWFLRRGLPAVVRGRAGHLVVRTVPAIVALALYDALYDVLTFIDGDADFDERIAGTTFLLLYTSVLLGSVVLPAAAAWLAGRVTRRWVLQDAGFLPGVLVAAGYVLLEPLVAHRLQDDNLLLGAADNLVTIGILYGLTAAGLGSIFCWALRAALRQLRGIGMMTSRSLPLLLLVTTFGFYTAEIWQSAGSLRNDRVWLVVGFFAAVAVLFLFSVLSAELQTVAALSESARRATPSHEYPFPAPAHGAHEAVEPGPPLTRAERANMVFILLLTQALQAMVFGILVFVLFAVLGLLSVPGKVMAAWSGHPVTQGALFGIQVPIANELLHVCMLIAAFSALYFIVTVVTDAAHRSTFYEPVLDHLKVSLTARADYLTRFAPPPAPARTG